MQQILTILGSVGFNWHVALANFFNFLIILFLLNKFFFKKIGKTIDERHHAIESGLQKARDAEVLLSKVDEEKRDILRQAHEKEASIIREGELKAKERAEKLTKAAEEELEGKKAALQKEETTLRERLENELSEKAPYLVAKLYAKTLKATMTEEENNALIAKIEF